MANIKLGDLYSLKNHPYEIDYTDIKISAFASMTPPILVVSEILNSANGYDPETGKEKAKQVKCIFYSHKSNKFENSWFDIKLIKSITKIKEDEILLEKNGEIKTSQDIDTKIIGINYPKSVPIGEVKNKFLNRQVVLKSCDYELGKIKTTFSKIDNKSSQKLTSHLDFIPPVLTVIDVKINEEKITYSTKTGNQNKIASFFLLK